jgi:hypothetical protein
MTCFTGSARDKLSLSLSLSPSLPDSLPPSLALALALSLSLSLSLQRERERRRGSKHVAYVLGKGLVYLSLVEEQVYLLVEE